MRIFWEIIWGYHGDMKDCRFSSFTPLLFQMAFCFCKKCLQHDWNHWFFNLFLFLSLNRSYPASLAGLWKMSLTPICGCLKKWCESTTIPLFLNGVWHGLKHHMFHLNLKP
jgi:hypothetical protein